MNGKRYCVEFPDDPAAGMHRFSDVVHITVESGNPGGGYNEFNEYMRVCLAKWFDGASVEARDE